VIDEASQIRATELALALTLLAPEGRLVLVGDDLQLPPITKGEYPPPGTGGPGSRPRSSPTSALATGPGSPGPWSRTGA
jgi:superfamily I DNA and/or RNA helicase